MDAFTFIIALVGTVGLFIFLLVVTIGFFRMSLRRRDSRSLSAEEGRMLVEIWDGLQKMEARIDNLETILIGKERRK